MNALRSPGELTALGRRLAEAREELPVIVVPAGTCGQASGAADLTRALQREILERGLAGRLRLRVTGCHGFCEQEASLLVEPSGTFYPTLSVRDVPRIVRAVAEGETLEDLLYVDAATGQRIRAQRDIPFYQRQTRTILGRNEAVDPIRITDSLAAGGYAALGRALAGRRPEELVDELKAAGLRGRGGAGYPTGLKWEVLAERPATGGKILVCNADEGDPGAYMDRAVLEGNPHSIIEGLLLGAYATGATRGVIYIRNEYSLAIKHLIIAIRQAQDLGLLGPDVLGTGLAFDIRLVRGAAAFVCGEETALIAAVEGRMAEPRQRPPYPAVRGIGGAPTLINNVETWANVPVVLGGGADAYAAIGLRGNHGTKIFSLAGKVRHSGLVEVPMGTPLRDIVYGIGGGPAGHHAIKAVQIGGPSGGCVPYWKLDVPVDYDSLEEAGTIMGSGGLLVLDDRSCVVDLAQYFLRFLKDESCGKCFPCRKGTQRLHEILVDIAGGTATQEHLDLVPELGHVINDTSLCGLGQTAANPALTTYRYFPREYARHVHDRRCDAFVCRALTGAPCQAACPLGTEAWRYVAHLASGALDEAYRAVRERNPFPSVCARVCDARCETHCRLGAAGYPPVAIRALKRAVTDRADPASFVPTRAALSGARVAVVGAGPAGLTCAHLLAGAGHEVTLYEAEPEPGGVLLAGVPAYRLPPAVVRREIDALLRDPRITLECNRTLGHDVTIDGLFAAGHRAVFLALGTHRGLRLGLSGEAATGVVGALELLRAHNLRGEALARGRVGVIGGGNAAVEAARVAVREARGGSVTLFYRRTRAEMPATDAEVEAALAEGVRLEELVSPLRLGIEGGALAAVTFVRNRLGDPDQSGRRVFAPLPATEHVVPLDTLVVAVGAQLAPFDTRRSAGIELAQEGSLLADRETFATGRAGVFASCDRTLGPRSVVDAIAAGQHAATMIGRYLRGEELGQPGAAPLPSVLVPRAPGETSESDLLRRAAPPLTPPAARDAGAEVERVLDVEEAGREARRCLRCDLEFTAMPAEPDALRPAAAAAPYGIPW